MSQRELAVLTGVTPETVSRWKKINGFIEWLSDKLATYRQPIYERLEFVAYENLNDFRFWSAMAEKHGFLNSSTGPSETVVQFIYSDTPPPDEKPGP